MARKRKGGRRSGLSRMGRKIASVGGTILITGPVWVPAVDMVTKAGTNFGEYPHQYLLSATGFDISTGGINQSLLQQAAIRDAAMVGFGLFAKWLARRA